MDLPRLIAALSEPSAYPEPAGAVEVVQTHISVVFLTDRHAYKIKKPVQLGFVDFSTLEERRRSCEREVELNRRLAPSVYLGVVPIAEEGGGLRVEGRGEPVEWAVKMTRLPEDATLLRRLGRGDVDRPMLEGLAGRIAAFHAAAESGPEIAAYGRFDVVAANARENFDQAAGHVGTTVDRAVFDRLRRLTDAALDRLRPLIEARAGRGVPRDTHGDLRLCHVYLFPHRRPPDDLVVIDCIEFADRFRHADPVADAAFLVMELARHGRRDLGRAFAAAYAAAAGDAEGLALLPFYVAYRAAVRAKVLGMKAEEAEIGEAERAEAVAGARAHWLVALGMLEEPGRRPCLVLVAGLPGSGKSTLARGLAEQAGFEVVRSDEVRKELAGLSADEPAAAGFGEGIYGPEWDERTYAECEGRAGRSLLEGRRVAVDASFGREADRRRLLGLAARLGVPALLLVCRADPAVVRERLAGRSGDASDADWSVHQAAAGRWEPPGPGAGWVVVEIDTGSGRERALDAALGLLRDAGLGG